MTDNKAIYFRVTPALRTRLEEIRKRLTEQHPERPPWSLSKVVTEMVILGIKAAEDQHGL